MYNDPLVHLFEEFDTDGDGHLTADEIAAALRCGTDIPSHVHHELGVIM